MSRIAVRLRCVQKLLLDTHMVGNTFLINRRPKVMCTQEMYKMFALWEPFMLQYHCDMYKACP